jgi:hypothetical protein
MAGCNTLTPQEKSFLDTKILFLRENITTKIVTTTWKRRKNTD